MASSVLGSCAHKYLTFVESSQGGRASFERVTSEKRDAATCPSGRVPKSAGKNALPLSSNNYLMAATFPGPLVLPDDDLAIDPECPPQSLRSWIQLKERNEVTRRRRTIYIAAPPIPSRELQHMYDWSEPRLDGLPAGSNPAPKAGRIRTEDVMEYIAAYYHPLPVKQFPHALEFLPWQDEKPKLKTKAKSKKQKSSDDQMTSIALSTGKELIQIRNRPGYDDIYSRQLNLNDLLDVAIEVLPDDAYALLMISDHELYEDDDDDFCCGRAYGGSRIAVVSTARYHPLLDSLQDVDMRHGWPASHCDSFVRKTVDAYVKEMKLPRHISEIMAPARSQRPEPPSPMRAAISVYNATSAEYPVYLARVARTAGHELGHCFGMDHCVYYACSMQGTASAAEDIRQPPYLCPVDLAKLLRATGGNEVERYKAIATLCDRWAKEEGKGGMWASHAAWIRAVVKLKQLSNEPVDVIMIDSD